MNEKTNRLRIRTPEGIVFAQELAGPISRFFAWLVDFVVFLGAIVLLMVVQGIFQLLSTGLATALGILLFFTLNLGYPIALEWLWRGQTLGKRMMRLRVVDAEGLRLQFSQIVIRNLLRAVDMLPLVYLVGGLTCMISKRAQRLGDLAANTVVIRIPKVAHPKLDHVLSNQYNSLRDHPHLEARLRQHISTQEAGLALQALIRRDQLEPEARLELFHDLATHFQSKTRFPEETLHGIPDEQFVHNIVDVLYRPRHASGT